MANRFVCDRCGKEILYDLECNHIKHREYRHHHILFKRVTRFVDSNWDLCQQCGDAFIAWFKHPEQDEKED